MNILGKAIYFGIAGWCGWKMLVAAAQNTGDPTAFPVMLVLVLVMIGFIYHAIFN